MTSDQQPATSRQRRLMLAWQCLTSDAHADSRWSVIGHWSLVLGLLLVALLLRVTDLGGFVVEDEARYWIDRSYHFLEALERGDYAATAISTHPGVTTMWSGSLGIVLQRTLLAWSVLQSSPFPTTLALMRLPAVLAHVGGILIGYALLRRMLPLSIATLAALFWATDPFVIAFSRMLHVDGLMATFATVSILAACSYWHHNAHPATLILSAVCAGLSVLSKSPGLVVLPIIVLIAVISYASRITHYSRGRFQTCPYKSLFAVLALWFLAFLLTLVIVWPAVWADPLRVYQLMRIGVEVEGGSPHVQGNFFLGRPDDEPGMLFYPAALALRLTPWTMLGLLLLPLMWRQASGEAPRLPCNATTRRDLSILAAFILLFTFGLDLFSKKLNRYLMPAFPAVDILAAVGLGLAIYNLRFTIGQRVAGALLSLIAVIAIVNAALWHPYSIAYFNPVLGGAQAGARTFLIGVGEGLEQAADWLNVQPDIQSVVVATTMKPALQPYLRKGAQASPRRGEMLPDKAGYAVLYVRNIWNGASPPFDQFFGLVTPLHVVRIHGVDYAWIYQVPPPEARFGSLLHLGHSELDVDNLRAGGVLTVTTRWWTSASLPSDYMLFIHVLDAQGQRVAQVDVPPAGPNAPASRWEPGRYYTWSHPVPVGIGNVCRDRFQTCPYWLAMGLYAPDTFARLPVQAPVPPDAPDAGGNALLIPLRMPDQ